MARTSEGAVGEVTSCPLAGGILTVEQTGFSAGAGQGVGGREASRAMPRFESLKDKSPNLRRWGRRGGSSEVGDGRELSAGHGQLEAPVNSGWPSRAHR